MNTFILFGMLLCFVTVYGKHLGESDTPDPVINTEGQIDGSRNHGAGDQNRHRRKRRQGNYDYQFPYPHPFPYPERREYDRYQQDHLPQIVRLLEELLDYVKRPPPPPPPPQPIYIPYPVPYIVPQYVDCSCNKVNVTTRFPEMEDPNQNWGFEESKNRIDDSSFPKRPISFDPIKPKRPIKRPPKVEHGSETWSQGDLSTQAPNFAANDLPAVKTPTTCNAAVLTCCNNNKEQQKLCFNTFGCGLSYENGNACSKETIAEAIKIFKEAYSPVQP